MKILISALFMGAPLSIGAQKPGNFAGKWELDHSRSDAEFRDYQITCSIDQSSTAVTVNQEIVMKGGQKSSMPPVTFNLDGSVISKEEQGSAGKISAVLSPDGKTLTTKFVTTMNGSDYGTLTVYTLSADSKTLTIKSSDLNKESPMVQVYIRK